MFFFFFFFFFFFECFCCCCCSIVSGVVVIQLAQRTTKICCGKYPKISNTFSFTFYGFNKILDGIQNSVEPFRSLSGLGLRSFYQKKCCKTMFYLRHLPYITVKHTVSHNVVSTSAHGNLETTLCDVVRLLGYHKG